MWCLLLMACGCHKQPDAVPEPVAAAAPAPLPDPTPTPTQDEAPIAAVHRALSARDAGPSCADLEAMTPDPVTTLLTIVADYPMPPQAPMRAATCLVDNHPQAIGDTLVDWMTDPAMRGLGLLVVQRLDTLPTELAARVTQAGLNGPVDAELRAALAASAPEE